MVIAVAICTVMAVIASAKAKWKPEYANVPQSVRDWYETRELTPAAQQRFRFKSCCAHSDVVKTKFKVSGTGNDEWWWLDGKTWKRVPDDIIHWGSSTPTGEPIMFAVGNQPTCFFPADGGI